MESSNLAAILTRYIRADLKTLHFLRHYAGGRSHLLFAYSLRSALLGESLGWTDLAHLDLRKRFEPASSGQYSAEAHNKRPFGNYEGIFRALAKLDPQAKRLDYQSLLVRSTKGGEATRPIGSALPTPLIGRGVALLSSASKRLR